MMSNLRATFQLFVNKEYPELLELYKTQIEKHNNAILTDPYPNSGFDLHFPQHETFDDYKTKFVNFQIKGQMIYNDQITGYYMYPRSSISKTPLILANHVGVIDGNYRGNILGAFRNLSNESYSVKKNERLLQICHSSLCPIFVELVDDENDLVKTTRGEGGFGSTGR
jgi:dUTP pyrophosphatase